jgi:L-gulono-1,4-lactone dehydrogenase
MERVCVTGASGGIGRVLVARLARDFNVKCLFRSDGSQRAAAEGLGCEIIEGDLRDVSALDRLVRGTRAVFHCAASVTKNLGQAREINVEGTRRLAERAAAAGCERFVHFSSASVYLAAAVGREVLTEETQLDDGRQLDAYSRSKLQSEQALQDVCSRTGLSFTILRPTCVYGPGVESWTLFPLHAIGKGIPMHFGRRDGWMNIVYVADVAEAAALALRPEAGNQTYNVGGEVLETREFLGRFARMAGRRLKRVPESGLRAIVGTGNVIGRFIPLPAGADPRVIGLMAFCTNFPPGVDRIPSTKLRTELGFEPRTLFSEGMLKTRLWLDREGRLPRRVERFRQVLGNFQFKPDVVFRPSCEDELRQVIDAAIQQRRRVRTIGSLHSMSGVPVAEDMCLVLERYRDLVDIDGERVTVQAGMQLCQLNQVLAEHGLALPVLGSVTEQTISGAVSTGTHGGSKHQPSITGCVESARLMTGTGELLDVDASDARFYGAVQSLGLCGILSTLTLRCVPAFSLRSTYRVAPLDEVLQDFDELQRSNDYLDLFWHPIVNQVEIWAVNRTAEPIPINRELQSVRPATSNPLGKRLTEWGFRYLHRSRHPRIHRRVVTGQIGNWYTQREGRSDYVLAYLPWNANTTFPMLDMESAVATSDAISCVKELKRFFDESRRYPVLGVRLRCQQPDQHWLSGAYERETCWIESHYAFPGDDFRRHVHDLLAPFAYRPHWGKNLWVDAAYIAARYPRWADFQILRKSCDPYDLFLNPELSARISVEPPALPPNA